MMENSVIIGQYELFGLADVTVDYPWTLNQLFPTAPQDMWERYRTRYPEMFASSQTYRSDFNCYLLRGRGRTILIDTAMGIDSPYAKQVQASGRSLQFGQLLSKLSGIGVMPEMVDIVVLTHLHPDHVGWNITYTNDKASPTFPNARYLVNEIDWTHFHQPEIQAEFPEGYIQHSVTPLKELSVLEFIDNDYKIAEEITAIHTPGHTPGHMSIVVNSEDDKALVLGDVIVHPAQVSQPTWNARTEHNTTQATITRESILTLSHSECILLAASHLREPGFGHVKRSDESNQLYWDILRY